MHDKNHINFDDIFFFLFFSTKNLQEPEIADMCHVVWMKKFNRPIPNEISSKCTINYCGVCLQSKQASKSLKEHYEGNYHFDNILAALLKWDKQNSVFKFDSQMSKKCSEVSVSSTPHIEWTNNFDKQIPTEISSKTTKWFCGLCSREFKRGKNIN